MNRKEIKIFIYMSLVEPVGLLGCIWYSYLHKGTAPLAAGILGMLLLACSFTGSMMGFFARKQFRDSRNYVGKICSAVHMLVCIGFLTLYMMGLFLS